MLKCKKKKKSAEQVCVSYLSIELAMCHAQRHKLGVTNEINCDLRSILFYRDYYHVTLRRTENTAVTAVFVRGRWTEPNAPI